MKNKDYMMATNHKNSGIDPSLIPAHGNGSILIVFETPNHDENEPNLTSPVYNLGIDTWPTKEWVRVHTEEFIQTVIKPNGLYADDTVIWMKRLFTKQEIAYKKKNKETNFGKGVAIDAIRIKDHYSTAYNGNTNPWGWEYLPKWYQDLLTND
jgi:hypothetical protein